jgi:hypothetical protein
MVSESDVATSVSEWRLDPTAVLGHSLTLVATFVAIVSLALAPTRNKQ